MDGAAASWRTARSFPALLLTLTAVTGVVDAVSYLQLGHVFVANMTGNVVFLGFALAGAEGLSVAASLLAIAAFLVGAFCGGRLAAARHEHRGRHLATATTVSLVLLLVALGVAAVWGDQNAALYVLTAVLALAMGVQNATARALAVPDLTTTVLTLTLTGLAADSIGVGGPSPRPWRRIAAVLSMLAGALAGGLLCLHVGSAAALALACLIQLAVATASHGLSAGTPAAAWAKAPAKG